MRTTVVLWGILLGCFLATARAAEGAAPDVEADSSYVSKVVKVADGALTVHTFRGHSGIIENLETDDKTETTLSGKPAKLTDLKAGQWVRVYWKYVDESKKKIKVLKVEEASPPPMHKDD